MYFVYMFQLMRHGAERYKMLTSILSYCTIALILLLVITVRRSMATDRKIKRRPADLWPQIAKRIRREEAQLDNGIAPRVYNHSDGRRFKGLK